jgi:hypothetical protein
MRQGRRDLEGDSWRFPGSRGLDGRIRALRPPEKKRRKEER